MKHHEAQGADINPDAPDEVWERGEDGALHLVDEVVLPMAKQVATRPPTAQSAGLWRGALDALMNQDGDCGLLTEDEVP